MKYYRSFLNNLLVITDCDTRILRCFLFQIKNVFLTLETKTCLPII